MGGGSEECLKKSLLYQQSKIYLQDVFHTHRFIGLCLQKVGKGYFEMISAGRHFYFEHEAVSTIVNQALEFSPPDTAATF